jgi:hypothetical protein
MMAELMPQMDMQLATDYFNKTLLDYTGKSFNELKGRGWAKIVHPDDFKNKRYGENASKQVKITGRKQNTS